MPAEVLRKCCVSSENVRASDLTTGDSQSSALSRPLQDSVDVSDGYVVLTPAARMPRHSDERCRCVASPEVPPGEIGAVWGVKERLRTLLTEREPSKIRWRLADFYDAPRGSTGSSSR